MSLWRAYFLDMLILNRTYDTATTFFFFNDTATTEIYTLSLHDALPISPRSGPDRCCAPSRAATRPRGRKDRKSTRLNSSHSQISYAVFCLKKKKKEHTCHNRDSSAGQCRHGLRQRVPSLCCTSVLITHC